MSVLLAFNEADSWNVEALSEATKIKPDILVQVLQILLKAKLLVGANNEELDENNIQPSSTGLDPYLVVFALIIFVFCSELVPWLQEQEVESQHQHPHEDGAEAGDGADPQTHRGGQEAADPGGHRQDHEDQEGSEAQSTHDRGPQSVGAKVTIDQ